MKLLALLFLLLTAITSCKDDDYGDKKIDFGISITEHPPVKVTKSNSMRVYMHYMPWFDSPEFGTGWGIHWTMSSRSPNVTDDNGKREIASHYYPLIGPYDSQDPAVVEYHLLLMKYAGIDGILINWYGVEGTNGDIGLLLENSEAIIDLTDEVGMSFGVVMEDRFAGARGDAEANVAYLDANYYSNAQYIRIQNRPLTLLFGPITIMGQSNWLEILNASQENEIFMPLWYNQNTGSAAAGQFAWVYRDAAGGLTNFYNARSTEDIVGGAAYPGFKDYYEEGGWTSSSINWEIPVGTATMEETLDLAASHAAKLDFLQLVTWNDFGEGTMIEPTQEFGFTFLEQIQAFTGVSYGEAELELIYELYTKRKDTDLIGDKEAQKILDQAFYNLVALKVEEARELLDALE